MSDIQDDIASKAEEVNDSSAEQHLGDAMDDAEPEAKDGREQGDADVEEGEDEPYSFPPE